MRRLVGWWFSWIDGTISRWCVLVDNRDAEPDYATNLAEELMALIETEGWTNDD